MTEYNHIRYNNRALVLFALFFLISLLLYWNADWRMQEEDHAEYLQGYASHIAEVIGEARDGYAVSVFNIENHENIAREYGKLVDVAVEEGNNQPLLRLMESPAERVLSVAAVILAACLVTRERQKGLSGMIYGTPGGRGKLGLRRIALIWTVAGVSRGASMAAIWCAAGVETGVDVGLGRAVQSAELFSDLTYPVTIGGYLIRYWLITTIAMAVTGMIVWIVLSVCYNLVISLSLLLGAGILEYFWAGNLTIQSSLRFLKYINVVEYLRPDDYLLKYQDIALGGHAVSLLLVMKVGLLVMAVLFFVLAVVVAQKDIAFGTRRSGSRGWFGGWSYHLFLAELYKLLIIMKGLIVLAAVAAVLLYSFRLRTMEYTDVEKYVNRFLEEHRGTVTEQTYEAVAKAHAYVDETFAAYEEADRKYSKGELDRMEFMKAESEQREAAVVESALAVIEERLEYIETLRTERGIEAVLMNDSGYRRLLASGGSNALGRLLAGCAITALLMALGTVVCERQGKRNLLLSTTPRGRRDLFRKKQLCVAVIVAMMTVFLEVAYVVYLNRQFGLPEWQAAVQSVSTLAQVPFSVSLRGFWLLVLAVKTALSIMVSEGLLFLFQRLLIGRWGEGKKRVKVQA